jgi:hypothetical protein
VKIPLLIITLSFLFGSCDKGYRVRFANYHTERMDTVLIGDKLYFTLVEPQQVTEYLKVTRGTHGVKLVTKSGLNFHSEMKIPSSGSGDRTLQIDAISQIDVLER